MIFLPKDDHRNRRLAMNNFERQIAEVNREGLHSLKIETLQVNLGLRCNQQCNHCHLEASPQRREMMGYDQRLEAIRRLNNLGSGSESGFPLSLVYNPGGPFLPPPQSALEED